MTAAELLRELWARLDTQQWDSLAELLDEDVRVEYVHTGDSDAEVPADPRPVSAAQLRIVNAHQIAVVHGVVR